MKGVIWISDERNESPKITMNMHPNMPSLSEAEIQILYPGSPWSDGWPNRSRHAKVCLLFF